ncbi:hypothetical protein AG1IA_09381 [Rhizoctonia solani AG-1 IA]|uniref:Uncharacterized protein n=1 Tax=Thanatephorus cucumeris (strain AG1-IA) TaxID=983506 RepID=L8WJP8_THACA|nr:hypothetical protein AG1IA_09381 [Rhizoctonia solani AG-1 IA]
MRCRVRLWEWTGPMGNPEKVYGTVEESVSRRTELGKKMTYETQESHAFISLYECKSNMNSESNARVTH